MRSRLNCLDKQTGKVVWSHDLWTEIGAKPSGRGFSSSPTAYQGMLILPVGGKEGHGIMAFDLKDGGVVWTSHNYRPTFSSPIVIEVDGQDQLIVFTGKQIVGMDPNNGKLLWEHPHSTQYNINASTPVWGEDNLL